jgi:serine phosphatase RsbU (regulator of sigma subunit)
MHYLISGEVPPIPISAHRRQQIILRGVPNNADYVTVPAGYPESRISRICGALSERGEGEPTPFIGSVRSSNFIAFLNEFAEMLKGKVELKEVAQVITDKTCELFNAEGASILVPNMDHTHYRVAYHKTPTREIGDRLAKLEVPADKGITGWVHRNRTSILINDATKHLIFNPDIDEQINYKTEEIMAAPISIGKNLLGILEVLNPKDGHFQESDLQTMELIAAVIAIFIDKATLYEGKIKYAKVQNEFEIAHRLQTRLMPNLPSDIGPFRLIGESRQLSRVGGDFWDVFDFSPNEKLLIIGDVSGHGLSASLMMAAVRTASRALLHLVRSPYDLIEPLNYVVNQEFSDGGHYVTLILCHIHIEERRINCFRAGHEKPFVKLDGVFQSMDHQGGLPIGLLPFRNYDPWQDFALKPGDALYLFTDGVVDGLSEDEVNLHHIFEQHPNLEEALDEGAFFETFIRDLSWEDRDDATLLKLCLR